ncbi:MAG TPA: hypothetical protein V6D47_19220 [Oscillatoriaceae cyanobacterium]
MANRNALLRPRTLGLSTLAGASLLASCASWVPSSYQVPQLYIKGYTIRARGEQIAGTPDSGTLNNTLTVLQNLGVLGVFVNPKFIFSADPVLMLQTANDYTMPAAETTTEPAVDVKGNPTTETVFTKPLFMLDAITISYQVPNFSLPDVTLQENLPIKSNSYTMPPLPLPELGTLIQALTSGDPSKSTIEGTFTVNLRLRDLDPLAGQQSFTVSRSFPFEYTTTSILAANTSDNVPGFIPSATFTPAIGGLGAALPSAAPTQTPPPSASPTASPVPPASAPVSPIPI